MNNLNDENFRSDLTYETYQKFVLEYLPKIIKRSKKEIACIIIEIHTRKNETNIELRDSLRSDDVYRAKDINIQEFLSYLNVIPNYTVSFKEGQIELLEFFCNKQDLINYYHEELQREEHEINKTR